MFLGWSGWRRDATEARLLGGPLVKLAKTVPELVTHVVSPVDEYGATCGYVALSVVTS